MFQFQLVPSLGGPSHNRVQGDGPAPQSPPLPLDDSPAQRLPGELILKIVEFALEDCDSGRPGNLAIFASHICAHWRAAIIGCPSLWTDVFILNSIRPNLNLEYPATFIKRSQELPLTVTIEAKPGYIGGEWVSVSNAIAALIRPLMDRVREYHLAYTPCSRVEDVMGMLPRSHAPLLEVFSVRCFWQKEGFIDLDRLLLPCLQQLDAGGANWRESIALFPALRDLRFSRASPSCFTFSVRNLRSLVLHDLGSSAPNEHELQEILRTNASTLRTLAITNSFPINLVVLPCTLPVLESLTLGDCHPFSAEIFVAAVAVPSLTELTLLDTRTAWISEQVQGAGQTDALANMMRVLPLHQIRTLSLSHLVFLRTGPHGGLMTAANCEATPRALFSQLHQLENLKLVHPDVHTVHALLHPPYLMNSTGSPVHPMPLLSHMTLECVDERMYMYILNILQKRATVRPALPPVRRLEEMTVRLQSRGHKQLDSRGFRIFTENVAGKVIYKDMDDVCPFLPGNHDCQCPHCV